MLPRENTSDEFKRALSAYYADLLEFLDDGIDIVARTGAGRLRKEQSFVRRVGELRSLLVKRLRKMPPPVEKKIPPLPQAGLIWPNCPTTGLAELRSAKTEAEALWWLWDSSAQGGDAITDQIRRVCAACGFQAPILKDESVEKIESAGAAILRGAERDKQKFQEAMNAASPSEFLRAIDELKRAGQ